VVVAACDEAATFLRGHTIRCGDWAQRMPNDRILVVPPRMKAAGIGAVSTSQTERSGRHAVTADFSAAAAIWLGIHHVVFRLRKTQRFAGEVTMSLVVPDQVTCAIQRGDELLEDGTACSWRLVGPRFHTALMMDPCAPSRYHGICICCSAHGIKDPTDYPTSGPLSGPPPTVPLLTGRRPQPMRTSQRTGRWAIRMSRVSPANGRPLTIVSCDDGLPLLERRDVGGDARCESRDVCIQGGSSIDRQYLICQRATAHESVRAG